MREDQDNEIRRNTAVRMCRRCGVELGDEEEMDICFVCRGRSGEGETAGAHELRRGREDDPRER